MLSPILEMLWHGQIPSLLLDPTEEQKLTVLILCCNWIRYYIMLSIQATSSTTREHYHTDSAKGMLMINLTINTLPCASPTLVTTIQLGFR